MKHMRRGGDAGRQGTLTDLVTTCVVPDGVVVSVKDTVTVVVAQISSDVGFDGAAVPQPTPPPALEKFTVVTRN